MIQASNQPRSVFLLCRQSILSSTPGENGLPLLARWHPAGTNYMVIRRGPGRKVVISWAREVALNHYKCKYLEVYTNAILSGNTILRRRQSPDSMARKEFRRLVVDFHSLPRLMSYNRYSGRLLQTAKCWDDEPDRVTMEWKRYPLGPEGIISLKRGLPFNDEPHYSEYRCENF